MKQINIDIRTQTMLLKENEHIVHRYVISTALNGTGELENTGCTPRGYHVIAEKIGDDAPINSVFVARQPTGEIYDAALAVQHPERDWILSRILWLEGCIFGKNKGNTPDGQVCDSKARYIYIHGTPDSEPMGIAKSHGCIRMRNTDVIALYDWADVGTAVMLIDDSSDDTVA